MEVCRAIWQDQGVDDQAQGAQSVLLPLLVTLAQFPPLAMKDRTGQAIAALMPIQLGEGMAPIVGVGDEIQEVKGLGYTAQFPDRPPKTRDLATALQGADKF